MSSYALPPISPTLPLANAVVLPLALATAAAGLYEPCYLRALGATLVFGCVGPDVMAEIVAALEGSLLVGAYDVISEAETAEKCVYVLCHFARGTLLTTRAGEGEEEGGWGV